MVRERIVPPPAPWRPAISFGTSVDWARRMTEKPMIARIWHGRVLSEKSAAYRAFLAERAIPDYHPTPGFRTLQANRKDSAGPLGIDCRRRRISGTEVLGRRLKRQRGVHVVII